MASKLSESLMLHRPFYTSAHSAGKFIHGGPHHPTVLAQGFTSQQASRSRLIIHTSRAGSHMHRTTRRYAGGHAQSINSSKTEPSTYEPALAVPPASIAHAPPSSPPPATLPPAAFFDVDGTIVKSNVVAAFAAYQLHRLPLIQKIVWLPFFLLNIPLYLILDAIDRSLFNRVFYRSYRGIAVEEKQRMAEFVFSNYMQPRIFPGVSEYIGSLRSSGCHVVMVTGSPDFLVGPLAEALGTRRVFGARLKEDEGRFTGELEGAAVSSAEKAAIARAYAEEQGFALEACHAYGDSYADRDMLRLVGHAFAVKPDKRLGEEAREKGWVIVEDWKLLQVDDVQVES